MLGFLLVMIGISVAVVLLMLTVALLDGGFREDRILLEREAAVRRWQPPFARGGELFNWAKGRAVAMVKTRFGGKPSADAPVKLSAELHAGATRAMLPLLHDAERASPIACPEGGQGLIGITAPEVFEIADYVRRNLGRAEQKRIRDRALENARQIAENDQRPLGSTAVPCALQGENCMCRAYPSRPLHCRPQHARMIASQYTHLAEDAWPMAEVEEENVEQGLEAGLAEALQSVGLDGHVYELNSALVAAFDTPHAAQRWMEGEDVFAGCNQLR